MAKQYCTNCGTPLALDGNCKQCRQINPIKEYSKQCAFSHGGKQCPAPGAVSQSVKGDGRFYCGAHFRARHSKEESILIMENYIKYGVPERPDWRDELIEKLNNG